jgi:hypothetical protein
MVGPGLELSGPTRARMHNLAARLAVGGAGVVEQVAGVADQVGAVFAGQSDENIWAKVVPFLAFDVEIRKVICSTNATESVNARAAAACRGHVVEDRSHPPRDRTSHTTDAVQPTSPQRRWPAPDTT